MLLGWCTRIGWALAQRSNGPGCSVAHVSRFANSPTLCRKRHLGVCACRVKNAGYHSPSSCRCKKIARRPCLVYERGSSTLSFTRNVERNTLRPLSHVPEQRMTVLNFWRSAVVWSVACAERRATKAYAERPRIVAGRNAIEYGFDSQEFGGCLESYLNQNPLFKPLRRVANWS